MSKKIIKHKNLGNIKDIAIRQELDFISRQVEDYISTTATDNPEQVTKVVQQAITQNVINITNAGTLIHSDLSGLDYASAGHTDFAGTKVSNIFTVSQSVITSDVNRPLLTVTSHGSKTPDNPWYYILFRVHDETNVDEYAQMEVMANVGAADGYAGASYGWSVNNLTTGYTSSFYIDGQVQGPDRSLTIWDYQNGTINRGKFSTDKNGNVGIGSSSYGLSATPLADAALVATDTGKVGIGTVSPTDKLQVIGDVRAWNLDNDRRLNWMGAI